MLRCMLFSTQAISSSTALSPPTPLSESKEEKNRKRCRKYQEKMKKKAKEEQSELERLKERNCELKATVQRMEEVVAWYKSLLRDACRKLKGDGEGR